MIIDLTTGGAGRQQTVYDVGYVTIIPTHYALVVITIACISGRQ